MKFWTLERRTAFGLAVVFILLGVLNVAIAFMTFQISRSLSFALLNMTLFFSLAAFIVVRRIIRVLLRARAAGELLVAQLRSQEAIHAQLIRGIEQVDESIVVTDLDGSIVYVNPAFENITGYSRTDAIGRNPRILKSGSHPVSFYNSMWTTLLRGETWSGDLINRRKDGSLLNEVATISPVKDDAGAIVSFVAVKRDNTQELLLRQQSKQAQKMEAMGRLAGGVAHDFNNLLMVIRTYTQLLQNHIPNSSSLRGDFDEVHKAVERGASLTRQMLAFSRKQMTSPAFLDLNEVIGETAKMLRRATCENIELDVTLCQSIWTIKADRDQIVQVIMNLWTNASDAMPQGGTLRIGTDNVTVQPGSIGIPQYILPGQYVMFSITDSGGGVSKENQAEVFEPFFTTKGVGEGTGLGLAMVYGIVKQSGGYVWLESEYGHGARFTIYLPKVCHVITPTLTARLVGFVRGTETVLIVEDEGSLRRGFCEFLTDLGYFVLTASSGEEALPIISGPKSVDLLITDVILPKMSGRELAQVSGALRPRLKVIYMSGYTDDEVLRYGFHQRSTAFLQKPFGLNALACKVRETLECNQSAHQSELTQTRVG